MTLKFTVLESPVFVTTSYWMEPIGFSPDRFNNAIILTDSNVVGHCLPRLLAMVPQLSDTEVITVEPGVKNLNTVEHAISCLMDMGANRDTLLVCLGGGTIGDLGGFVASVFKRGMPYVNIPTTLLAMADSCVGGKTALDFAGVRNLLGTFKPADAVIIDPEYLQSLDDLAIRSGMAEIVKHAAIGGDKLWQSVTSPSWIPEWLLTINASLDVKKRFVEADPFDRTERKALNFGHTAAHAIEAVTADMEQPITHGEAVAFGLLAEGWLSVRSLGLPESDFNLLLEAVTRHCHVATIDDPDREQMRYSLSHDKKNHQRTLRLTLLENIGQPRVDVECTMDEVIEAIENTIALCLAE